MPLLISEAEVASWVLTSEAREAVRSAHLALASGDAVNVPRLRARTPTMSLHQMAAASSSLRLAACKVYSATDQKVESLVLLYSTAAGELLAMIAANELGRLRTAATSVLATLTLTPPPLKTMGLIGSGYQAEGLLRAYHEAASILGIEEIAIYSREPARVEKLLERASAYSRVKSHASRSVGELVEGSDLLVTATTSSSPLFEGLNLSRLRHISAIGSNALSRRELSPKVVTGAKIVVVDDRRVAEQESGNLLAPLENGKISWGKVLELGRLLQATADSHLLPGSLTGYSIFCSHGLAIQDLYLAKLIYDKAIAQGKQSQAIFPSM